MNNRRDFLFEKYIKPNTIGCEIGVYKGDFSERIIQIGKPEKLHLIDPWILIDDDKYDSSWYGKKNTSQEKMDSIYESVVSRFNYVPEIKIHRGKSLDIMDSFNDNYFDWIYIDADHSYDGIITDLTLSYNKTNKYIIGDDYISNGWWGTDIIDAVDFFVSKYNVKLIEVENGQFIIKKITILD